MLHSTAPPPLAARRKGGAGGGVVAQGAALGPSPRGPADLPGTEGGRAPSSHNSQFSAFSAFPPLAPDWARGLREGGLRAHWSAARRAVYGLRHCAPSRDRRPPCWTAVTQQTTGLRCRRVLLRIYQPLLPWRGSGAGRGRRGCPTTPSTPPRGPLPPTTAPSAPCLNASFGGADGAPWSAGCRRDSFLFKCSVLSWRRWREFSCDCAAGWRWGGVGGREGGPLLLPRDPASRLLRHGLWP